MVPIAKTVSPFMFIMCLRSEGMSELMIVSHRHIYAVADLGQLRSRTGMLTGLYFYSDAGMMMSRRPPIMLS